MVTRKISPEKPSIEFAKKILPPPLFRAIQHIFAQNINDCVLVGGTCLAGFYAGHRRSDDIDLFVKSEPALQATILAVKSLKNISTLFEQEIRSNQYFHATCCLSNHYFTIDIVADENLFRIGKFIPLEKNITIASLETILRMKAATSVSRCSEKDLYDLCWLIQKFPNLSVKELLDLGQSVDGGVTAENILSTISSTLLNEESCHFSIDSKNSAKTIYTEIKKLQDHFILQFRKYLKNQPVPLLGELVKKSKKRVLK